MTKDNLDTYRPENEDPEKYQEEPMSEETKAWYERGDELRNDIQNINDWLEKFEAAPEEYKQHEMSQASYNFMTNRKKQLEQELADYDKEFEEEQTKALDEFTEEDAKDPTVNNIIKGLKFGQFNK